MKLWTKLYTPGLFRRGTGGLHFLTQSSRKRPFGTTSSSILGTPPFLPVKDGLTVRSRDMESASFPPRGGLSRVCYETEPFKQARAEWMVEQGKQLEQLYNADETAHSWRIMPNKTLAGASETAAPGNKKVKDRVSPMPQDPTSCLSCS